MPRYRKFRKRSTRSRRKTSSNSSRWNTSKATGRRLYGPVVNFMPNSIMRKMKYTIGINLNPAASNRATHVFLSNGIFQPNVTGGGTVQPRGFDQLMGAYRKWTVLGSKITVTQTTAVTGGNGYLFLTHSKSSNPLVSEPLTEQCFENQAIVKKPLILADNSGNMRKVRVSAQVGLKKFFKANVMDEKDFSGDATANAPTVSNWGINYQHVNGSDPDSMHFLVEIDYIVVFRNPKSITAS